jgi:hypothetical protein
LLDWNSGMQLTGSPAVRPLSISASLASLFSSLVGLSADLSVALSAAWAVTPVNASTAAAIMSLEVFIGILLQ